MSAALVPWQAEGWRGWVDAAAGIDPAACLAAAAGGVGRASAGTGGGMIVGVDGGVTGAGAGGARSASVGGGCCV